MAAAVSSSHDRQSSSVSRPATTMPPPHPPPIPSSSSHFPFFPVSYALRSSLILISLFLIFLLLSLPLPSSSQSSHATPISSYPLHRDSATQDGVEEDESPQAPLVPHLSTSTTPSSPNTLMGANGRVKEVEGGVEEAQGEGSFWLFELLVLIALIPSVIGLQRRKQYVMALHNRRLDRMVKLIGRGPAPRRTVPYTLAAVSTLHCSGTQLER